MKARLTEVDGVQVDDGRQVFLDELSIGRAWR